jgi:flavin-dependent dehydrogenase
VNDPSVLSCRDVRLIMKAAREEVLPVPWNAIGDPIAAHRSLQPAATITGISAMPAARRLLADMGLLGAFLAEGHPPCHGNRAVWGDVAVHETDFLRDADGHGWHLDRCRFDAWLRFVAIERGAALLRPAKLAAIERDGEGWRVSLMTRDGPVGLTAAFVIDSGGRAAPLARRLGAVRRPLGDRLVCGWVYGEARTNADDAGFSTVEAVEDGWWYTAPLPGQRRALAYLLRLVRD